jgi:hypothetical protein
LDFPEHADAIANRLISAARGGEDQGLALPEGKKARPDKAFIEHSMGALLEGRPEVDKDVPANDQMEIVERCVGNQVVLDPRHVAQQLWLQPRQASD